MVYITSWDEFAERTLQMFRADPDSCLKFKTDQAQEAKKMEKLNNLFFTLMARGPDADVSEVAGKEQMETQPAKKGRGRKQ
ncbi:Signal recognition particle 9 kDa protein [Linum perenne]